MPKERRKLKCNLKAKSNHMDANQKKFPKQTEPK